MGERSACIALDARGETEVPAKPNVVFDTCCYERLFGGDAGDSGERADGHLEEALQRDAELVYMVNLMMCASTRCSLAFTVLLKRQPLRLENKSYTKSM